MKITLKPFGISLVIVSVASVLGLAIYSSSSAKLTPQQQAVEQLPEVQKAIDADKPIVDRYMKNMKLKDDLLMCAIDAHTCPLAPGETPAQ